MSISTLERQSLRLQLEPTDAFKVLPGNGYRRSALPLAKIQARPSLAITYEIRARTHRYFDNHAWIRELRNISDEAIDDAIIVVLDKLDQWLERGQIKDCILLLSIVDPEEIPVEISLALLAGTRPAERELFEARRNFYERLEARIRREMPEHLDLMLRGLRP